MATHASGSRRPSPLTGRPVSRRTLLSASARLGLGTAALGTLGTALSACSGDGDGPLSFWQWYAPQEGGTYAVEAQSGWFTTLVEDWNALGGRQVELTYIPVSEYIEGTQLQSAFAAGEGPDIFVISPGDFLRYHNGDVLYDLTDALGERGTADFHASALATRTVGDRLFGLPMEAEPVTMFYDVRAFEDAGLSEGDIPRTWDDLLSVADRLTTDDRYGLLFETAPNVYQNFTWYPFLWQAGGAVVDESGLLPRFDSPETVRALALWQDAIESGVAPRTTQGGGGGDLVANLAGGYAAMAPMVTAGGSFLETGAPDFEYGMFPLPVPDADTDPVTVLGGWSFCVNSQGRDPAAAAEFCAWALAGEESTERMASWAFDAKKSLPVRTSVMRHAQENGLFGGDELMSYAAFEAAGFDPDDPTDGTTPLGRGEPRFTPAVVQAVTDAIQAVQLSGVEPEIAAETAHEQIAVELENYSGAPLGS
ncbi:ABC transporter substrate-binding protein [Nocardiopsis aegyptia]|uniref:ABC transporter substrate-binding protein n=1 Tax=Nocardiopsis aegyptia TaxID=220378 RepID=UPI00366A579B